MYEIGFKVNLDDNYIITTLSAKDAFATFDEWKEKYSGCKKLELEIMENGQKVKVLKHK